MSKINSFFLLFALFLVFSTSILAQKPATASELFERGVEFLKAQKYSEALDEFRKSAQLDAKHAATHANIGSALMMLGRGSEAIPSFREAIRLVPNDASFHMALCGALSLEKNHTEAIRECEEGVRLGGESSSATHVALMAALRNANRAADAAQKAEIALQKFAQSELVLAAAAEAFAATENFTRALELYEKLAAMKPNEAYYQVKLAENYLRFERDAEALAAARKALETDSKHFLAYFFIGKIYFELGQHEEAAAALQKSAELNPQFADAFYFLGISEGRRNNTDQAVAAFRQALALAPAEFNYNYELGSELTKAAKYEEAIAPLRRAVELKPKDMLAAVALGTALGEAGLHEEAIKYLMIADELKPGDQIINMLLSVSRYRQQMAPQIPAMIAYAKENPQDLNVRVHLIQNLTYNRRLAEAEQYFDEIWKMNSPDARVYETIGTTRISAGNYEKAAQAYRKAIEISNSPAGYLGLANVYAKNNQLDEAMRAYEKVFEMKPDTPNIMKLYADYLRDNGRRREALDWYKRSLAQLPTNAPAVFNAGVLSAKLGDLAAARQYHETLKTLDPAAAKILARVIKMRW